MMATKGNGCILKKGRNKWEIQLSTGRDELGRYKRISRTVTGTKADAVRVRDRLKREIADGIKVEKTDKMTFKDLCKLYTESRRKAAKVKAETIDKDEKRLDFVCEIIGDLPLRKIDVLTIEALYGDIRDRRMSQGYSCGTTTLHAYHVLIKSVLQKGVDCDFIPKNPCSRVDAPSVGKSQRRSLTADEAARLLSVIESSEDDAYRLLAEKEHRQQQRGNDQDRSRLRGVVTISNILALRIGLATGMRLSEILRLRWELTDLQKGRLAVDESKTEAGRRVVAIDNETKDHLLKWKCVQRELLDALGVPQTEKTPVLCDSVGHKLNVQNFERWWRKFRTDNGFDGLLFHSLRHSQATLLLSQGADLKTIQARLGHSDASLTLNWYAHALPENDDRAAQMIGALCQRTQKHPRIIPMPKSA